MNTSENAPPQLGIIEPGDVLSIDVSPADFALGERLVKEDGTVPDVGGGSLAVAGLDEQRAARKVARALARANDLSRSRLAVTVKIVNVRPVYVLGEVSHAGEYPFEEGLTLSQLVFRAGGYNHRADVHRAFVERAGKTYSIDVSQDETFTFAPGDIIRIPQRYF